MTHLSFVYVAAKSSRAMVGRARRSALVLSAAGAGYADARVVGGVGGRQPVARDGPRIGLRSVMQCVGPLSSEIH